MALCEGVVTFSPPELEPGERNSSKADTFNVSSRIEAVLSWEKENKIQNVCSTPNPLDQATSHMI